MILAVCAAGVLAAAYYAVQFALVPAMVAGRIPILSPVANGLGYDESVFREFTERALPGVGWILALITLALYGRFVDHPQDRDEWWRRFALAIAAVTILSLVLNATVGPVTYRGDAHDYLLTSVATANHLTPEIRASDIADYTRLRLDIGLEGGNPYDGSFRSELNGQVYQWHFWLFPLVAAPFHLLLEALSASPLHALEFLNIVMFALALGSILRTRRLSWAQRALFIGLICFSPITWYVPWTSAEVFAASLVVIGACQAIDGRWIGSLLALSLATTQNPALLPLVAATAAFALWTGRDELSLGRVATVGGASALALGASAFYFTVFGVTNPIQAAGMASLNNASIAKVLDFFVSLDQGVLPFAPVVMLGSLIAAVEAVRTRDLWTCVRVIALVMCVALTTTTVEWNSDAVGLRRHATWLLPVMIWLTVELIARSERRRTSFALSALAIQLAITVYWVYPPVSSSHSDICNRALLVAGHIYHPLPDVFAPRTAHTVAPYADELPVCLAPHGEVRKVLVDPTRLKRIDDYLVLTPKARQAVNEPERAGAGLYYLDLPAESAYLREQDAPASGAPFELDMMLGGPSQYGPQFDRFNVIANGDSGLPEVAPLTGYSAYVTVRNTSTEPWYPGGDAPIGLVLEVRGERVQECGPQPLLHAVMPGENAVFYAHFVTPAETGTCDLGATLVQTVGDARRNLSRPVYGAELRVTDVPAAPPLDFVRWTGSGS